MIQIKKNNSDIPNDYLLYIERRHYREQDFIDGHHNGINARDIFNRIKQKQEFSQLKEKLIRDQGYICCYCNANVPLQSSTVEHLVPISINKSLLAEYRNLLISCNGGRVERVENRENIEQYPLYCDAHRGNSQLNFTPLHIDCWSAFDYSIADGSVRGTNQRAQEVLGILNLDCVLLRTNRLEALSILFDDNGDFISDEELEKIWDAFWERDEDGKHEPYFFAIIQNIYNHI